MQPLKLINEQKEKLLEMAQKLFPKYDLIEWGKKYYPDTEYLWFSKRNKGGLVLEIHWFEFCFVTLTYELSQKGDYCLEVLRSQFLQSHPIDFLYEIFKKLKL